MNYSFDINISSSPDGFDYVISQEFENSVGCQREFEREILEWGVEDTLEDTLECVRKFLSDKFPTE